MAEISRKTLENGALILIIILVALGSFGLGRLSVKEAEKEPLQILNRPELSEETSAAVGAVIKSEAGDENAALRTSSAVVASKNSDKYHFPWCPGAKQISEKNKITFSSAHEAEEAGYTKAANCK